MREEERSSMLGIKTRNFVPLVNVSLEELVPADHFYRQLEQKLDLSFVRGLTGKSYARGGRPSIDPIVFFKLQLVMFFGNCSGPLTARAYAETGVECSPIEDLSSLL